MQKDEPVCFQCSRIFPTCCVAPDNKNEEMTILSDVETDMIRAVTGKNTGQYIAEASNSKDFLKKLASLFPYDIDKIVKKNKPGSSHYRLIIKNDRRCSFLTDTGCLLPYDSKPLFCRIYPFWVMDGEIKLFTNSQCLALLRTSGVLQLYEVFNTTEKEVFELYNKLRNARV
jgi:Fe-S-cluster containining protein